MTVMVKDIFKRGKKDVTDLITRPMGRKYFTEAEKTISSAMKDEVVIVDFDGVKVMDPSFADEFLIKLIDSSRKNSFFLRLRNLSRSAENNIRSVVDSYLQFAGREYALAVENVTEEGSHYIGKINSDEKQILEFVRVNKIAAPADVAQKTGISDADAKKDIDHLVGLRLLRLDDAKTRVMPVL